MYLLKLKEEDVILLDRCITCYRQQIFNIKCDNKCVTEEDNLKNLQDYLHKLFFDNSK